MIFLLVGGDPHDGGDPLQSRDTGTCVNPPHGSNAKERAEGLIGGPEAAQALKRGCGQYGIELVYRERTHHGGHIERLIGTKMSKLKSLPGATGGSPKARRSYDPDKHAALTLGELEAWFAQQIVGRYHQDPLRSYASTNSLPKTGRST